MNIFKKKLSKKKLILMLVFSLISLLTSILIQYMETTKTVVVDGICKLGGSCESVQNSIYGYIFGVPLAVYGIIGFTGFIILLILELIRKRELQRQLIIIAGIGAGVCAIIFIGIQAFILQQFCTYCMIADTSAIIISGIILFSK